LPPAAAPRLRFTSADLNGWYASFARRTAIAEVAHHLRREAVNMRVPSLTLHYRTYTANLAGTYQDIRAMAATRPELYKADDYTASQTFGEAIRASGGDGILYDSVRHVGGANVVALRPKNVRDVVMGNYYEITAGLRQSDRTHLAVNLSREAHGVASIKSGRSRPPQT
jgi:hypothetical protein